MILVSEWNCGYETSDTKRNRGRLIWVRQNILMGDVRWARLWLRPDAPQVWAGWTAIVWCAAQAEIRGTVESAEDVAILSRVPPEMVEAAMSWALSCGLAEEVIHGAKSPQKAPPDTHQKPKSDQRGSEWPLSVDRFRQPSMDVFLSAVAHRFPRWLPHAVSSVYAIWSDNDWCDGSGNRIADWQALAAIWYKRADSSDKSKPQ